ncbi:T9SS type A sorting domain-containing protein [Paenimyroides viscosum]|uniref:T9SS C-terminal target domain-containing protein n=1 Tax=Paenimyroides viscosum TaxID=2488729 RepID=A0A3P1B5S3_9FLAO|nr:T9SS type A sorting domain-containing protein [Paenimyroides viscosum]RRA96072.1 T9SS C-terminal target domain-containing protein [Paenimyroides viscosum]
MKKQVLFVATFLFATQLTTAQVLYSENFDNLTLGNVGTDFTGATPGQGGWHTYSRADNVPSDAGNNYFKIVSEPNKGKVLQTSALPSFGANYLLKSGIDNLWNNRNQGNNVLKVTYDFFTGPNLSISGPNYSFYILKTNSFHNLSGDYLGVLTYVPMNGSMNLGPNPFNLPHSQFPKLKPNTWYTLTFYIDYTNQKVYFSIPSLGFNVVHTSQNQIPVTLSVVLQHSTLTVMASDYKYDNIIVSAVSTVPTASVDNVLSSKFNIYPNPVTNMLTVTNSENITIKELTVYDVNGKTIKEQKGSFEKEHTLNVDNLSAGTYLLHIKTESGTAVKSFIKK